MANITTALSNILSAISTIRTNRYGKNVRTAIANLGTNTKTALEALNNNGPADGAISTEKIADGAVTADKLGVDISTQFAKVLIEPNALDGTDVFAVQDKDGNMLLMSIDGVLGYATEDFRSINSYQARICKSFNMASDAQAQNLNTLHGRSDAIDVIVRNSDEGEIQGIGFPEIQEYLSYGYHFTHLYGVEYFRSFYDDNLWRRTNADGVQSAWRNIGGPVNVG